MHNLRVIHKNTKAIKRHQDEVFNKWSEEMLEELREKQKKRAEKKYGVNLDHVRFGF